MERLLLIVLSATVGFLIGLFSPYMFPVVHEARQAQQAWLDPPTRTPAATPLALTISRPTFVQTAAPPTLQAPPAPTPEPTSSTRLFVVPLVGGGVMEVVANDEDAARNNVRSHGADPAD